MKTKPRSTALLFDMGKPVAVTDVRFDPITGQPQLISDGKVLVPKTVQLQTLYKRDKKEKITSSIQIDSINTTLNHLEALLQFDYLVAIDTNTSIINGRRISVTGVMKTSIDRKENTLLLGYVGYDSFAFRNASSDVPAEKLAGPCSFGH